MPGRSVTAIVILSLNAPWWRPADFLPLSAARSFLAKQESLPAAILRFDIAGNRLYLTAEEWKILSIEWVIFCEGWYCAGGRNS